MFQIYKAPTSSEQNSCKTPLPICLNNKWSETQAGKARKARKRPGFFAAGGGSLTNELLQFKSGLTYYQCFRSVVLLVSDHVDHYHRPNAVVLTRR